MIFVLALWVGVSAFIFFQQDRFVFAAVRGSTMPPENFTQTTLRGDAGNVDFWTAPPYLVGGDSNGFVLYLHGNGGNLNNTVDSLTKWREKGYRVAALDYRGYGASEGSPSVAGLVNDAELALRHVRASGISEEQIIVHGHSLGGAVATRLAAKHPNLRALIVESSFTSLDRVAADMVGPVFPYRLLLDDTANSLSGIKKVRAPIVVINGSADPVLSPSYSLELAKAMPCGASAQFAGSTHYDAFTNHVSEVLDLLADAETRCSA